MCGDLYGFINKWTWFDNIYIYIYHAIARGIKSFEYVVKAKIESKSFQFFKNVCLDVTLCDICNQTWNVLVLKDVVCEK